VYRNAQLDDKVSGESYRPDIAKAALEAGTFVPPFSMGRMTWIKPSFNWMMYRCGFARKAGQEVVLGIDITRAGFEWALEHAVLSHYEPSIHSSHDEWRSSLAVASLPHHDKPASEDGNARKHVQDFFPVTCFCHISDR